MQIIVNYYISRQRTFVKKADKEDQWSKGTYYVKPCDFNVTLSFFTAVFLTLKVMLFLDEIILF